MTSSPNTVDSETARKLELLKLEREKLEREIVELKKKVLQILQEEERIIDLEWYKLDEMHRKQKGLPSRTYDEYWREEYKQQEEIRRGIER